MRYTIKLEAHGVSGTTVKPHYCRWVARGGVKLNGKEERLLKDADGDIQECDRWSLGDEDGVMRWLPEAETMAGERYAVEYSFALSTVPGREALRKVCEEGMMMAEEMGVAPDMITFRTDGAESLTAGLWMMGKRKIHRVANVLEAKVAALEEGFGY